jgi:AbrB family looped-hinge helix DNA binding protein
MSKAKNNCCAKPQGKVSNQIEAILSIDERGQMVLPKETRARAGIRPGDKLALISWSKGDRMCCLSLIKAEDMADTLTSMLNALMVGSSESDE